MPLSLNFDLPSPHAPNSRAVPNEQPKTGALLPRFCAKQQQQQQKLFSPLCCGKTRAAVRIQDTARQLTRSRAYTRYKQASLPLLVSPLTLSLKCACNKRQRLLRSFVVRRRVDGAVKKQLLDTFRRPKSQSERLEQCGHEHTRQHMR